MQKRHHPRIAEGAETLMRQGFAGDPLGILASSRKSPPTPRLATASPLFLRSRFIRPASTRKRITRASKRITPAASISAGNPHGKALGRPASDCKKRGDPRTTQARRGDCEISGESGRKTRPIGRPTSRPWPTPCRPRGGPLAAPWMPPAIGKDARGEAAPSLLNLWDVPASPAHLAMDRTRSGLSGRRGAQRSGATRRARFMPVLATGAALPRRALRPRPRHARMIDAFERGACSSATPIGDATSGRPHVAPSYGGRF